MKFCIVAISLLLMTCVGFAESWPTYRHDNRRSGVTTDSLTFPLQQQWVRESAQPPLPAWTGPAKWDAYSGNSGLQSMRNFDPCFYVTVAEGRVLFGSSVDDAAHALDAKTGKEVWIHFTGAPVRFPPTLDAGRVYFGSDDGTVYCCDATTGNRIWKRDAAPNPRYVPSNRKLISVWPVRTGVLIQDETAFFAGSLVPWEPSYLWRVDAKTGQSKGDHRFQTEIDGVTLQGALLSSENRIYVPQGRAAPLSFDFQTGESLGAIGEAGGVFCILTEDELLLAGPQNQKSATSEIRVSDANNQHRMASFSGTNRILVAGQQAWIPVAGKLKSLNRKVYVDAEQEIASANQVINDKKLDDPNQKDAAKAQRDKAIKKRDSAWRWEIECPSPLGFIKTANAIILGLDGEVRSYHPDTGQLLWKAPVSGAAHGLAVADGQLFVSTGLGHIYAFGSTP